MIKNSFLILPLCCTFLHEIESPWMQEFQPSYDIVCLWSQGLFRAPPAYTAQFANSASAQSQHPV